MAASAMHRIDADGEIAACSRELSCVPVTNAGRGMAPQQKRTTQDIAPRFLGRIDINATTQGLGISVMYWRDLQTSGIKYDKSVRWAVPYPLAPSPSSVSEPLYKVDVTTLEEYMMGPTTFDKEPPLCGGVGSKACA